MSDAAHAPDPIEAQAQARDAAASRRNRRALLWITIGCVVLGAAGWAFAKWMMTQPPPPH
ncbi:MAG: hypothetical protein ACM3JJ_11290 [Hyphomicrobiales bacterium]